MPAVQCLNAILCKYAWNPAWCLNWRRFSMLFPKKPHGVAVMVQLSLGLTLRRFFQLKVPLAACPVPPLPLPSILFER